MGAGQATLAEAVDFAALDAAMDALSCSELTRGAEHARQLRAVLALAEAHAAVGWEIAIVPQIALSLGCSENRAARLLTEAQGLAVLPGAIEAVECGLLTVEQTGTVLEQLAVLDPPGRVAVWQRLQARLMGAADGTVGPHPLDELSPDDLDEELWHLGLVPDDVGPWVTPVDLEPADGGDALGNRLSHNDTRWTLDLDDPYRWC